MNNEYKKLTKKLKLIKCKNCDGQGCFILYINREHNIGCVWCQQTGIFPMLDNNTIFNFFAHNK